MQVQHALHEFLTCNPALRVCNSIPCLFRIRRCGVQKHLRLLHNSLQKFAGRRQFRRCAEGQPCLGRHPCVAVHKHVCSHPPDSLHNHHIRRVRPDVKEEDQPVDPHATAAPLPAQSLAREMAETSGGRQTAETRLPQHGRRRFALRGSSHEHGGAQGGDGKGDTEALPPVGRERGAVLALQVDDTEEEPGAAAAARNQRARRLDAGRAGRGPSSRPL
mmetsp:Transcript_29889/g.67628  ORF Transcript_29889/g.67628 Transcript_29889/m.67628 type:complete len:218 (+) Transcript_29889:1299-1952(+)